MSALARAVEPRRLASYATIGILNTALSAVAYLVLLAPGTPPALAGGLAFLVGAGTSYVLNRGVTFHDGERAHGATLWRFAVVTACGAALTAMAVAVVVDGLGVPAVLGQLVAAVPVAGATYELARRWAFAPRDRARAGVRARLRVAPELAALLALSAVLGLWDLNQNGWANTYYSAAVKSMSSSWHNFLFASFDAAGVMTVDKPPLSLWVQALSARIFGFNHLSLLVPQALMGVAATGLVYDLVRRRFGRLPGFVAGLAFATTPMTVAIDRHNNPDALLVLLCVAAVWCVVRGLEDGRARWIVAAGALVGLGFETKMGAALLVVPALAAAWLWVAPRGRITALRQLLAGGAVMTIIGLAWPVLVALTPASDRPWISGTTDNSAFSLAFSYNGLGRIDGQSGGPQAFGGRGGANSLFGGSTGPLRLLNDALGPQAGWLLAFALAGGLALVVATRLRRRDIRTGWLVAVGGTFATIAVTFSMAKGIFHPYYVSQLAPFTAALVGGGAAVLVRGGLAGRVLGAVAVAASVIVEIVLLHRANDLGWLVPLLGAAGAVAAVALLALGDRRARGIVLGAALAVLLVAPSAWAVGTLGHPTDGTFPAGGPASARMGMGGGPGGLGRRPNFGAAGGAMPTPPPGTTMGGAPGGGGVGGGGGGFGGESSSSLTAALQTAKANGGGTVAVLSQSEAATAVINGQDAAGIGGFSGRESQVSAAWLQEAIRSGRIRWVITSAGGGRFGGQSSSATVLSTVQSTCTASTAVSGLYDCATAAS